MLNIWKLKSTAKDNMVSIKFIIVFQQTEFLLQLSNTLPSLSSCSTPYYGILQKQKVYMCSNNYAPVCRRKSQLQVFKAKQTLIPEFPETQVQKPCRIFGGKSISTYLVLLHPKKSDWSFTDQTLCVRKLWQVVHCLDNIWCKASNKM